MDSNIAVANGTFNSTSQYHHEEAVIPVTMYQFQLFSYITLIPAGFILNSLSFIIFLKSKTYKSATGIHLICLCIADNMVLVSLLFIDTSGMKSFIIPHLYQLGLVNCALAYYTLIAGYLWSGVLLTSATIERFLSVAFPLKIKMWNLYKKSKIFMVVYFIITVGCTSYFIICMKTVTPPSGYKQCVPVVKYMYICHKSDIIINTVLSNSVCFILIFFFTILTAILLFKMAKERAKMSQDSESGKEYQITVMLVIVAVMFLFLRIPEMIIFQLIGFFEGKHITSHFSWLYYYMHPLFAVMMVLNHCVNFFIYIKFLKTFKTVFNGLLPCVVKVKREPPQISVQTEMTEAGPQVDKT